MKGVRTFGEEAVAERSHREYQWWNADKNNGQGHAWELVQDGLTYEEGGAAAGATFDEGHVLYTLALGNWESGTIFRYAGMTYTVVGTELHDHNGVVWWVTQGMSKPRLVKKERWI